MFKQLPRNLILKIKTILDFRIYDVRILRNIPINFKLNIVANDNVIKYNFLFLRFL